MDDNNQSVSSSCKNLRVHEPSGYGYVIVSPYEDFNGRVKIYRGESAAEHFIKSLDNEHKLFFKKIAVVEKMVLTEEDENEFNNAENCFICTKPFLEELDLGCKVRDHDHITGAYRGPAHSFCNLQMSQQTKMIVFMHNAKG